MDTRKEMGKGVLHALPEAVPVATLVVLGDAAGRDRLAVLRHGSLLLGDEVGAGRVGEVGDEPEADQRNEDADDACES